VGTFLIHSVVVKAVCDQRFIDIILLVVVILFGVKPNIASKSAN